MYGRHVHEAVIANKEKETGITVHLVNEEYDKGEIILQAKCNLSEHESVHSLAEKVHALEHAYLPKAIEKFL